MAGIRSARKEVNMRLKTGLMVSFALFCAVTCFASVAAAGTTGGFVKFEDPHEKAFTLEVPEGWTVKGGLFRLGFSDERPMVDMTSPDGKTNVRLGDVAVAPYFLPSPSYPNDGEPYDLGAQGQPVVAKFRTGGDFAALYAKARFRRMCQNVARQKIDSPLQLPDVLTTENGATLTQWSIGQVAYACNTSSAPGPLMRTPRPNASRISGWSIRSPALSLRPIRFPQREILSFGARSRSISVSDGYSIRSRWTSKEWRMRGRGHNSG